MNMADVPADDIVEGKSAKELKRERRAKLVQDKLVADGAAPVAHPIPPAVHRPQQKQQAGQQQQQKQKLAATTDGPPRAQASATPVVPRSLPAASMISHIKQTVEIASAGLTPAFKLYAESVLLRTVQGTNARARGLVHATIADAAEFQRPADRALAWALDGHLKHQFDLLDSCCAFPPSLVNVVRWVRAIVSRLDPSLGNAEALHGVKAALQEFLRTRVDSAERIAGHVPTCVNLAPGHTVLIHGANDAVLAAVLAAQAKAQAGVQGAQLHVVVVDSAPHLSAAAHVPALCSSGARVTYCRSAGIGAALHACMSTHGGGGGGGHASVLLGAEAVMADGAVLGEAGQAELALAAADAGIPVYVLCESYKMSGKIFVDSLSWNEWRPTREVAGGLLSGTGIAAASTAEAGAAVPKASKSGEPYVPPQSWSTAGTAAGHASTSLGNSFAVEGPKSGGRVMSGVKAVSLAYDLTPAYAVTGGLISEAGLLPSSRLATLLPLLLSEYGRLEEAGREEHGQGGAVDDVDDEEEEEEEDEGDEGGDVEGEA